MQVSLVYLSTCLPDYFQGFSGTTFAVPLAARPRSAEVLKGLHGEIGASDLTGPAFDHLPEGDSPESEDIYAQLHRQADELFADIDGRKSWSSAEDLSESYAYFGVKVSH